MSRAAQTRYQKSTARKIAERFKKESRGRVCWPCGVGKTRLAKYVIQETGAKTVLVCVPTLALVKQMIGDDGDMRGLSPNNLCVCSAEELSESTCNLSIEVTTDPDEVAAFMRKRGQKMVFVTYQSSVTLSKGAKGKTFDLVVYDEAHRTAGCGKVHSYLLHDDNLRANRRLFLTATERWYGGKKDNVLSMDDETLYGKSFDVLSFKKAIEKGWLSDYKIVVWEVSPEQIAAIDGDEDAAIKATAIATKKVMDQKKAKKAIAFWSTRRRSKDFASVARGLGIDAHHIAGDTPSQKQTEIIKRYAEAKSSAITNAKYMSEGVDLPMTDVIVFGDPKKSTVDVIQQAGRATRPSPGKKFGYIIVPVIVAPGTDREAVGNFKFETVRRIIDAMGSVDDRLIDEIKVFKDGKKPASPIVEFTGSDGKVELLDAFSAEIRMRYFYRARAITGFWTYDQAASWMRDNAASLGINSSHSFRKARFDGAVPNEIPSAPDDYYETSGWVNWKVFTCRASRLRGVSGSFYKESEFVKIVHSRKLERFVDYRAFWLECDDAKLPSDPPSVYKKKWRDLVGLIPVRRYTIGVEKFIEELRESKHKSCSTYFSDKNKPLHWPADPASHYGSEWPGWTRAFGFEKPYRALANLSFDDWVEQVRSCEDVVDWKSYKEVRKTKRGWPGSPHKSYPAYTSIRDILGDRHSGFRTITSAEDLAREYAKTGGKTRSTKEYWMQRSMQQNLPSCPQRLVGWSSWPAFWEMVEKEREKLERNKRKCK